MNGYTFAVIVFLTLLNAVQFWYYTTRAWDMRRDHTIEMERLKAEYRVQDQMLRNLTLPQVMPADRDGFTAPLTGRDGEL